MAKIDFSKVELNISNALQHWFQDKLNQGKMAAHLAASTFYGFEQAKPGPQDSVIAALANWIPESEVVGEKSDDAIIEETLSAFTPRTNIEPETQAQQELPTIAPMFILRQRLLWFIRKRVVNIYKLLETTKEEVVTLRKKKELTPEEEKRVKELLVKSSEIHERLMKRLGIDTDTALVESEKKRHLTKRFNIRETWLPL